MFIIGLISNRGTPLAGCFWVLKGCLSVSSRSSIPTDSPHNTAQIWLAEGGFGKDERGVHFCFYFLYQT